jgi:two-component system, LytTR family, response regulator
MYTHTVHTEPILLSLSEGVYAIPPNNIIRLQASSNYTFIYLVNQRPILTSKVLKEFENMLGQMGFIRTHRSHLINKAHIKNIDKKATTILMNDYSKADISKRKRKQVLHSVTTSCLQE